MPLPVIARNTYPLHPTGYAAYWQNGGSSRGAGLQVTGRVPVWASYHDGGGEGRIIHLLLVRVLPQVEVVIVGRFKDEIIVEEIERAIRARLSKPRWPERKWWVSHIVYLSQPPKRRPVSRRRAARYDRFCRGRLATSGGRAHMLAFIPLSRLKLNVGPADGGARADVRLAVDDSKVRQQEMRAFVAKLAELERWERRIVHQALGHLLGNSYLDAVAQGSEQIAERIHGVQKSHSGHQIRSLLSRPPEDFQPARWLRDPDHPDHRRLNQMLLTISRFPMGMGPDPELSVRPWVPTSLQAVLAPTVPVECSDNMAMEILPDPENHSVAIRWVINALLPYTKTD